MSIQTIASLVITVIFTGSFMSFLIMIDFSAYVGMPMVVIFFTYVFRYFMHEMDKVMTPTLPTIPFRPQAPKN